MGESIRNIRLRHLQGRLENIARELKISEFSTPNATGWRPAINAYRCHGCIRVCVDLAGVEPSFIEIQVQPHRLFVRGQRMAPEPDPLAPKPVRVLAMEIENGPFEREITLETEVDPSRVSTEQTNGLLWIILPLRAHG